ncbi:hypothetical protein C5167_025810 [Papaver somniferum]|uniref:Knottin scorpion toxin-like domain-containing protein n=1 Tax=Papaver somniferum TaxID=3469 RepID=A0A4Y7JWA2_PAPSO|nr:hypothetical protein C5167_025810 [Papaver somniferum]
MASLKQFSIIALIFGFILVSSFANAARTIDGVLVPQEDGDCHYLGPCRNRAGCSAQCRKQFYGEGGICMPDSTGGSLALRCCCINVA